MLLNSTYNIPEFTLHRPGSIQEAVETLEYYGSDAILMAGGVDLVNRLKSRLKTNHLIYLGNIEDLQEITTRATQLSIGANVTHRQFETDSVVGTRLHGVSKIWTDLGSIRIRHKGTLVGNLMSHERTYDVAPVLSSLGASLTFSTKDGASSLAVEKIFKADPGRSNLGLCTAVEIPAPLQKTVTSYSRAFKPVATVAVTVTDMGSGDLSARIAIECAFPYLVVASAQFACCEQSQVGTVCEETAAACVSTLPDALDNHMASANYRRHLVHVLVRKELESATSSLLELLEE